MTATTTPNRWSTGLRVLTSFNVPFPLGTSPTRLLPCGNEADRARRRDEQPIGLTVLPMSDKQTPRPSLREILAEVEHLEWPRIRTAAVTSASVVALCSLLAGLVFGLDEMFTAAVQNVANRSSLTPVPFVVIWVLVTARLVWVSRQHKGPGGDLVGVFNATASTEWGGLTPSERAVNRRTARWVAAFAVATVVLSVLGH